MSISTSSVEERVLRSSSKTSQLMQNGAAFLFGAVVLFAVGFLPMAAAHNAAHDSRHSFAFPCH